MANGTRGDSPLTDMLIHNLHPFPRDMEEMLRAILAIQPKFPDGKRHYVDQVRWMERFDDWARGQNLDEGRKALKQELDDLQKQA